MKTLRTTIIVLVALVALLAVACGDSEEETVVEPAPEPTVAPTPVPPTPVPPTPEPEPTAMADTSTGTGEAPTDAMDMAFEVPDFGPDTTGQDVAEALLSQEEVACVTSALGPEATQELLTMKVLDPAAAGATAVFGECLTQENSVSLFLAGFKGVLGGEMSDDTANCIGNSVWPHHKILFEETLDPSVVFGFIPCLSPDEMTALQALLPQ